MPDSVARLPALRKTKRTMGKMPVCPTRGTPLLRLFQQREEFGPGARVFLERAEQAGGFHYRVLLFNSAHHHAKMLRLDHDTDAAWLQAFHQRVRNLNGELLLNLQPARENIDNARNFGKADDLSIRDVSHVRAADEWQQMMFAHRVKFDVLHQNDLACFRAEDRVVNNFIEVLMISVGEKFEGKRRA